MLRFKLAVVAIAVVYGVMTQMAVEEIVQNLGGFETVTTNDYTSPPLGYARYKPGVPVGNAQRIDCPRLYL